MRGLMMMAKHWTPGLCKTRLAHDLGSGAAAELQKRFIRDSIERFSPLAEQRLLSVTPPTEIPAFEEIAEGWRVTWTPGTFGQVVINGLILLLRTCDRVVFVPADVPTLGVGRLTACFELLEHVDVTYIPDRDGGLCAFGVKSDVPLRHFLNAEWCQPTLTRSLLRTLVEREFSVAVLKPHWDFDTVEALRGTEYAIGLP